ncbi:MAG: transporter [Deltaproteobacteria bacterium]
MKVKNNNFLRAKNLFTNLFILMALSVCCSYDAYAQKWTSARPDGHAPIGVMGEHTHSAGEFMLSYRYMFMNMDGMRIGTNRVSNQRVLEDFMVTPTDMDMQMHMFGLMYAPTDFITLMGMIPYVKKSMNHLTRMGVRFKTESEGLGDIKLTGLIKIFDAHNQRVHLNAGISFPTGSIDKKDNTPAGPNQQLPYPMQLGSGTVDLLPGITYLGQHSMVSWGAQVSGTIRLGENDRDYSLGNRFDATAWGAWDWFNWVSTSARMDWQSWGNIDRADPALNPAMVPTADPDLQGGDRLDLLFGLNFYVPEGPALIKGQRLAVEFGFPVYQDLNGPQLETDWVLWLGWQYAWSFKKHSENDRGHH